MGWAYMSNAFDKVVLYGGLDDTNNSLNTTWLWNPGTSSWSTSSATISTGPHSSTRMVYNSQLNSSTGGRIMLFEGQNCISGMCTITDDSTWFFDQTNWAKCGTTSCITAGQHPGGRSSEGLTVDPADPANPVFLLFGGEGSTSSGDSDPAVAPLNDTWYLSGSDTGSVAWTKCDSSNYCQTPPTPARASGALEYYGVTKKAILFGGTTGPQAVVGDTWRYDQLAPMNRWAQCLDVTCYPAVTDCMIGGPPPCARSGQRMAYYNTQAAKEIVLFGGLRFLPATLLNDTWLYSGGSPGAWSLWCRPNPGCSVGQVVNMRCCTGLTFDTKRSQLVLFGGQLLPKPHAYFDVWTWTPSAGWVCVTPTAVCNSPSP